MSTVIPAYTALPIDLRITGAAAHFHLGMWKEEIMSLLDQNIELRAALQDMVRYCKIPNQPNNHIRLQNAERLLAQAVNFKDTWSALEFIKLFTDDQKIKLIELLKTNQTDLMGSNDDAHDLYSHAIALVERSKL